MKRYSLIHQLLRLPNLLILGLTFVLIKVFKGNPELTDWLYSGKIYPKISGFLAGLTRGIHFSVAEYAVYGLIIAAVVFLVIRVIALITLRKDSLIKLVSLIITFAITAAYLVFLFYALWGFNFYRTSIDKKLALPDRKYESSELYTLCIKLAEEAAELRAGLPEDANGVLECDIDATFDAVKTIYTAYGADHELFSGKVSGIKPVAWSELLSKLRILGIYSGYTAEPNVNAEQPTVYLAFSAAHETAHYYGWAKEDEANFIAYMVSCTSDDPCVAYSAAMHALNNCSADLRKLDANAFNDLRSRYTEAMLRDLADYSAYYNAYADSKAGKTADKVNDTYLKANGQQSGTAAYGEDVILLLRYYDAKGLFGRS